MKIRVPDYFNSFKCIANECSDSCCIGWEIPIDDASTAKYKALDCKIGREICEKTKHGCFPLDENGRCAFLDEKGLCRIISSVGDGYLCDICREHPRYYGVGRDGIDGGIGLSCEAAAEIILSLDKRPEFTTINRDVNYYDEDDFADISDSLREILYHGIFTRGMHELIGKYLAYAQAADDVAFNASTSGKSVKIPKVDYIPAENEEIRRMLKYALTLFSECEALTDKWNTLLERAGKVEITTVLAKEKLTRPLIYYFTHRYVREGVEDMSLSARVLFALCSALAIAAISEVIDADKSKVKSAVLFSKNIEYSTDNVDYILDGLSELL